MIKNTINYKVRCLDCKSRYYEDFHPPYLFEEHPKLKDSSIIDFSEYLMALVIQKERELRQVKCKKCNSPNVGISHVKVDDKELFDHEELSKLGWPLPGFYFTMEIRKNNDILTYTIGGNRQIPMMFIRSAVWRIKDEIRRRKEKYFKKESDGYLFVAVSGNFSKSKLERFIAYQIGKEELRNFIEKWIVEQGIATEEELRKGEV